MVSVDESGTDWGFVPPPEKRPSEANCPAMMLFALLGGKWTMAILHSIQEGGFSRPKELLASLPGLSAKELNRRLRQLVLAGILQRRADPNHPHRVDYCLTEAGSALLPAIQHVSRWAEEHREQLAQLRQSWK